MEESPNVSRRRSKTLKAVFIGTTVAGVMKYRMGNFAWQMRKFPNVETVLWPYSHKIVDQNPWQVDVIERMDIIQHIDYLCDQADVVVWQTLDFPHSYDIWQDMKLRHQKPFLMEIDDYFMDIPSTSESHKQYQAGSPRSQVAMLQMKQSDALIVSTPYLAEFYKPYNQNIHVVPNSIDFSEWKDLSIPRHDRIRIGWIGGGGHAKDLEMVHPAIEKILTDNRNVWFYCIHGCPNIYKNMAQVYWTKRWAPINLYPKFMASFKFDIGITPLEDNNFNRGKSNLRWLEYSALRLPGVHSPLPDFTRSIDKGKTGFIASDIGEWVMYLNLLIKSESLRREMGQAAYQAIKENFNVTKNANLYRHILQEFL